MKSLQITIQITNRETQSLEKYFADISKLKMVSPEEEVLLTRRIREGDEVALEKLVKANLRFVVSVAKQYHRGGDVTLGDLISEGNVGLIRAAKKFDETRGFKFISYAVWWIRQSIMEGLSKHSRTVRLPANVINGLIKTYHTSVSFEQLYEREPSDEELSEISGLSLKALSDMNRWNRKLSFDAPFNDEDTNGLLDIVADQDAINPEEDLLHDSRKIDVVRILSRLGPREAEIIKMTFGIGGSERYHVSDIAEIFGLTAERVRQIKEKALLTLKNSKLDIQSILT